MRTFKTGGYTFYMLDRGEQAPNPLEDKVFCGAFFIWLRKTGKWYLRKYRNPEWMEIANVLFDSENPAFNFFMKNIQNLIGLEIR